MSFHIATRMCKAKLLLRPLFVLCIKEKVRWDVLLVRHEGARFEFELLLLSMISIDEEHVDLVCLLFNFASCSHPWQYSPLELAQLLKHVPIGGTLKKIVILDVRDEDRIGGTY